jgi:hypothetical protein
VLHRSRAVISRETTFETPMKRPSVVRIGEANGDLNPPLASFRSPNGFVVWDPLTGLDPSLNVRFLVAAISE